MVKVLKEQGVYPVELRKAYCQSLMKAAAGNEKIAAINCDLCSSMGITDFAKAYPERSLNVGIMESNGVGVAAGLSAAGMIPFFHSFAIFSTRRVYDQIFMSCSYAGLNVKILGGDPGVTATYNGGTHMAFEDVGVMRCIPGVNILEASDAVMLKNLIPQMIAHYGVDYLRINRKGNVQIYEEGSEFTIGKAVILREGTDVSLIASGIMVPEALKAADQLEKEGIRAKVIDMFTIKPIDRDCILECAEKTGAIVTAENHNIFNGLGSAVAEVLAENRPCPMERVGVQDQFGEVGQQDYLMERFGLTAEVICEKAKKVLNRKKGL
ncbi:transketolase family protein [Sinanaerobacter chloroacetimidivorans]|uniref:Transketolase family protein n=1 Tax=Sinanaerobacter chloroacetimidivorans TaxID=2818044 RepID=A0A8J7VZA5_9FIRM|nr:transketolase C-terminal domain-containing protein [Sinanaerobacter chloroacetimidivorans]MBR0597454.1 transketolase family protein [Sinanaerobacter chloroacetimidivorans]